MKEAACSCACVSIFMMCCVADYSGNKPALQSRLIKVVEIQDSLPEGQAKLKSLSDHVANKVDKLPLRAKEAMERDLGNLK
jgi:hypothetical protein